MRSIALCLSLFLVLGTHSVPAGAQNGKKWSAGLRTGAAQEFYSLKKKMDLQNKSRNIHSGFAHQVFVNRALGKKESWLLEAQAGYYAYSSEDAGGYYNTTTGLDYFYYNFFKTRVFSFQLSGRYTFLDMKVLNWKHYAGLTLSLNRNVVNGYGFDNIHTSNEYDYRYFKERRWSGFAGVEYFGKINLSKHLSVQYLLGYSFYDPSFAIDGLLLVGEPTTHKVNLNFGLGWRF